MTPDFESFFPDPLSDECAAFLCDVLYPLAAACENHYFLQLRRYHDAHSPPVDPEQPWINLYPPLV
jgi:hypothetical protein